MLKLTKVRLVTDDVNYFEQPGAVVHPLDNSVAVVTGSGLLGLDELQLEGRRPISAAEFVRGQRDLVGSVLPS